MHMTHVCKARFIKVATPDRACQLSQVAAMLFCARLLNLSGSALFLRRTALDSCVLGVFYAGYRATQSAQQRCFSTFNVPQELQKMALSDDVCHFFDKLLHTPPAGPGPARYTVTARYQLGNASHLKPTEIPAMRTTLIPLISLLLALGALAATPAQAQTQTQQR